MISIAVFCPQYGVLKPVFILVGLSPLPQYSLSVNGDHIKSRLGLCPHVSLFSVSYEDNMASFKKISEFVWAR